MIAPGKYTERKKNMAQGVLYYLPAKGIFRIKCGNDVTDLAVDKSEIARSSFSSALEEARVIGGKSVAGLSVDFILPHNMYGVDFITLPGMKRFQLEEAFKTELRSMYKNYKDIIFKKAEISGGKTITYRTLFVRKTLINEIKESFAKLGVTIERFIPEGIALYEGAVNNNSFVKKAPCVVLNMGEDQSYMAAYAGETFLGGIPIPLGYKALSDSRVVSERQFISRDASELLVINAKERAKATKLTMAIDLEEEIDETLPDEDEVIAPNPELPDLTVAGTDDELSSEDQSAPEDDEEDLPPAIKTLRKKAIRNLPKFMRREEPTTSEGYVIENFRLFEKRVLMLIRDMSLYEYYPKIENIFLALPNEYEFLLDAMRNENPNFKWAIVDECDEELTVSGAIRVNNGAKAVVF